VWRQQADLADGSQQVACSSRAQQACAGACGVNAMSSTGAVSSRSSREKPLSRPWPVVEVVVRT
jgi:hypothetical protein